MNRSIGKRINYLANQNRAYVNALLKEEGITHGECTLLLGIAHHEGLSQEDLRKHLQIDKSAIARVIKTLVNKGYVRREVNVKDHRYSCLFLTPLAKDKIDYIYSILHQSSSWLMEGLSEKEVDTVLGILDKMCESIKRRVE